MLKKFLANYYFLTWCAAVIKAGSNAENEAADGKVVGVTLAEVVMTLVVVGCWDLKLDGTLTYGATRHDSSADDIGVPVLAWFVINIP